LFISSGTHQQFYTTVSRVLHVGSFVAACSWIGLGRAVGHYEEMLRAAHALNVQIVEAIRNEARP
jgi:hypothetical protein